MEVSGRLHTPAALSQEEKPQVPIRQEAGWAPEQVWELWDREKYFAPAVHRIASHYTVSAIPAPEF
jgi:hypothetical protein